MKTIRALLHTLLSIISNTLLPNTYIVRIADLGGAFGCHGLNTKFDTNVEKDLQNLLAKSSLSI